MDSLGYIHVEVHRTTSPMYTTHSRFADKRLAADLNALKLFLAIKQMKSTTNKKVANEWHFQARGEEPVGRRRKKKNTRSINGEVL